MIQTDDKLISHLADLSCLALSGDEKKHLAEDFQKILEGMIQLCELDTDGVPECSHVLDYSISHDNGLTAGLRDDEVRPSLNRELILKNAPSRNDEMFIAPKTVE